MGVKLTKIKNIECVDCLTLIKCVNVFKKLENFVKTVYKKKKKHIVEVKL